MDYSLIGILSFFYLRTVFTFFGCFNLVQLFHVEEPLHRCPKRTRQSWPQNLQSHFHRPKDTSPPLEVFDIWFRFLHWPGVHSSHPELLEEEGRWLHTLSTNTGFRNCRKNRCGCYKPQSPPPPPNTIYLQKTLMSLLSDIFAPGFVSLLLFPFSSLFIFFFFQFFCLPFFHFIRSSFVFTWLQPQVDQEEPLRMLYKPQPRKGHYKKYPLKTISSLFNCPILLYLYFPFPFLPFLSFRFYLSTHSIIGRKNEVNP